MSLFPMFLKLEGRNCLVIGAGSVGEPKIRSLLQAGAKVRVIAPQATATVASWAKTGIIAWEMRGFEPPDLEQVFLVIAATSSRVVNEAIFNEARLRNILCNVVDDPELCDFYYPAVVRRGQFQLAISTGGRCPALAQRLRRELEAQYGPEYAGWVEELGKARQEVLASGLDPTERQRRIHEMASRKPFAENTSEPSGRQA